jgi:ABC-2 type transport system ATP-binding protein
MPAVETFDLTKDYGVGFFRKRPRRALDSLNLRVETGEIFGLLGPNGAGKSTTLKLLLRLVFPTSGSARILGRPLDDVAMHARIGFLPENPYFYEYLTPQEFLTYAGELFGMGTAELKRRVGSLLDRLGLVESRSVPLRKFSKGMVQRVGIAQALINDPDLVILDEPMSGLDPIGRREVRDLILDLKRDGKTIFFSTHILSDAETLCDRVAILNRGRLQGCGELREILTLGVAATEVVLENPSRELLRELAPLARSVVRTGGRVRLEVPEEGEVEKLLSLVLNRRTRIVSVNPVKMSLEDYFLARMGEATSGTGETEQLESAGRVEEKP